MTKHMRAKQLPGRQKHGLLTVEEAASILNKPRRTIYRWEDAGKMPSRVTPIWGRRSYFRLADIKEMSRRLAASAPAQELAAHE
jgi:excisionase family DNA binding protein